MERIIARRPELVGYRYTLAINSLYFGRLPASVHPPAETLRLLREGEAELASRKDAAPVDLAARRSRAGS